MSAATPRIASNAPDQRQLLLALGSLIAVVAFVVVVMAAQRTTVTTPAAPAAPAPIAHDHGWSQDVPVTFKAHDNGWSETDKAAPGLVIPGTNGGGLNFTGIPYTAPKGLVVEGSNGGGLNYTGIPYPSVPEAGARFQYSGNQWATGSTGTAVAAPVDTQLVWPPYPVGAYGETTQAGQAAPAQEHGGRGTRFAR